MSFCALSPQVLSPISLSSKLKLLVKRFHQIFIKKGRILSMSTAFFSVIVLNDCPFKLVNRKFPDSPHSFSNAPNLALTQLCFHSPHPAGPSVFLTERQKGHLLGRGISNEKSLSRQKCFFCHSEILLICLSPFQCVTDCTEHFMYIISRCL